MLILIPILILMPILLFMHTYIYIYIDIYTRVYMNVYIDACAYTRTCISVYTRPCMHVSRYLHVCRLRCHTNHDENDLVDTCVTTNYDTHMFFVEGSGAHFRHALQ